MTRNPYDALSEAPYYKVEPDWAAIAQEIEGLSERLPWITFKFRVPTLAKINRKDFEERWERTFVRKRDTQNL